MSMFKRIAVRNTNEDYCPVLHINEREMEAEAVAPPVKSEGTDGPRGELFVLAASIYFRARRNTRARAAGII
jgi:hypothetical protein